AQFVIDQRQELLGGTGIAVLDGGQDTGDFTHRCFRRWGTRCALTHSIRLRTIGRGGQFLIRQRNTEGNMNFSRRGSGRGPTRLALADAGRIRRRGAEFALARFAAQGNTANDLLRGEEQGTPVRRERNRPYLAVTLL